MEDIKTRIHSLAKIMEEFGLEEAKLEGEEWLIEFSRTRKSEKFSGMRVEMMSSSQEILSEPQNFSHEHPVEPEEPIGTPVQSPMMGIFYNTSSPTVPPFVKPGDKVTEGQVIGLIEAMKVFNEIVAPVSGTASEYLTPNGQLVHPGDVLIFIE